jgi:AraC-like DNA-binding protein
MEELELRRGLQRDRAAPAREMIRYSCLTYAARLIASGIKVEAAISLSGYHNKTVFCRNFRDYLGCQPHEVRGRSFEALKDWEELENRSP